VTPPAPAAWFVGGRAASEKEILSGSAPPRFEITGSLAEHFAWYNTRQSLERTFMAWVRTGVSLISFGFTIVQFFQRIPHMEAAGARLPSPGAPRVLGLALIGTGVLALAVSSWQYRRQVAYMWSPQFTAIAGLTERPHRTPALLAAIVLQLIGLFAFISIFVHLA
jgi:putative membrane protein